MSRNPWYKHPPLPLLGLKADWRKHKDVIQKLVGYHSHEDGNPSCLHTTVASFMSQLSSQTVPHSSLKHISTLPTPGTTSSAKRTCPSHTASGRRELKHHDWKTIQTFLLHVKCKALKCKHSANCACRGTTS